MKNGLLGLVAILYLILMPNILSGQSKIVPEHGYQ